MSMQKKQKRQKKHTQAHPNHTHTHTRGAVEDKRVDAFVACASKSIRLWLLNCCSTHTHTHTHIKWIELTVKTGAYVCGACSMNMEITNIRIHISTLDMLRDNTDRFVSNGCVLCVSSVLPQRTWQTYSSIVMKFLWEVFGQFQFDTKRNWLVSSHSHLLLRVVPVE